jgi:hypothetical protein
MRYFLSGVIYTRKVERGVVCSIRKDRGDWVQGTRILNGWGSSLPERLRGKGICGTRKVGRGGCPRYQEG